PFGSGSLASSGAAAGVDAVIGSRAPRMLLVLAASLLVAAGGTLARQQPPAFPHAAHAKVFVGCSTCHAGIRQPGAALFPSAASCASCHDGTTAKRVDWQPRTGPRISNLRFDHARHATLRTQRGDSSSCTDCHGTPGAPWMTVEPPTAPQCVACHTGGRGTHLTLPDTACATCHLTLARAVTLPTSRIARFPAPPTHLAPA